MGTLTMIGTMLLLMSLGIPVSIAIGVAGAIDAAVVDLGLGRVDGYAVANELRAHYGTHLTLIAYTGYSRVEVQLRAQENGFNRVILKPATVESIVAALSASQE